jgi:hypothetical protein
VKRRLAALAAPLIAGAVAAGCAGAGANPSVPALREDALVTKAEATAYAHAVNLGVSDVPGMVSVSLERESKDGPSNDEACGVRESHVHIVDIGSPRFRSGKGFQLEEVNSSVEVVSSAALAQHKADVVVTALRHPATRACVVRRIAHEIAKGLNRGRQVQIRLGHATASLLHLALPHSSGLRIVVPMTVAANGVRVPLRVYVDSEGFVVGPATVGLTGFSFSHPVPTLPHLLSVLYGRAKP